MTSLEYRLSAAVLVVLGLLFSILPIRRRRVVFATARVPRLDGNLARLHEAMRAARPDLEYVVLAEPYGYGLRAKLGYLLRLVRGMYYLRTSALFIVDNAYLPIHVAPHRPETTVVQVWHAIGALKRFGLDVAGGVDEPERTFLHRYYDYVVVAGEAAREPYATALRTPVERVLAIGGARADLFLDQRAMAAARERVGARYPALRNRTVVLYAPTFRGRGHAKHAGPMLDAARLRAALPDTYALALKTHPNLDPTGTETAGYDVVISPSDDLNDVLPLVDILITDYSSAIFEYSLLRRPLVLLVPDLGEYERDPGIYLDYRTEMIGTQVVDTDGVIDAILGDRFDLGPYDAFIERNLGIADGRAAQRFIERFAPPRRRAASPVTPTEPPAPR